jgi:hypothetical protein
LNLLYKANALPKKVCADPPFVILRLAPSVNAESTFVPEHETRTAKLHLILRLGVFEASILLSSIVRIGS